VLAWDLTIEAGTSRRAVDVGRDDAIVCLAKLLCWRIAALYHRMKGIGHDVVGTMSCRR